MKQTILSPHNSQRNYGIDLLRLVAAFYVIILHTINKGGIYHTTLPFSFQNYACDLLLIGSYCAVNIFGIISGYVGYREKQTKLSYSGYLPLWLTVVFYSVIITVVYMCIRPVAVTREDLIISLFPVSKNLYWYFSAYTLVFFLAPFLNRMVCQSTDGELKLLFLLICCVVAMIEYLGQSFSMENGYSAIWLLLLYLVGAIMKKTGIGSRLPALAAAILIILLDLCLFLLSIRTPHKQIFIFSFCFEIQSSYITPFYLASAILHVLLFSRLKFSAPGQRIIGFAAPAAFSVYIVNTQRSFWNYFMNNRFASWAVSSSMGMIAKIIGFSLGFVLAVVFLDYFRQKLFQLLGVKYWVQRLSHVFRKEANV